MLDRDLDSFRRPYTRNDEDDDPTGDGFAKAAGTDLTNTVALAQAIGRDLDFEHGGIGWWRDHLGARQRILIGDYLHQAVGSIKTNLTEARLHQLEGREHAAAQSHRLADAVQVAGNQVTLDLPPATRGTDELPRLLTDLHQTGFFRAIGSAVDCLGAAVIGVAALPTNLLRGDFGKARRAAGRPDVLLGPRVLALLDDAETASGPVGWLPWATDYRNMLVHRARRLELSQFVRRPSLLDATGEPIVRVDAVEQLAQDPGRSDIESMLAMAWKPAQADGIKIAPVLEEFASTTIDGVFASTRHLIERVTAELLTIWNERQADSDLSRQPPSQWPQVPSTDPTGFDGYGRGQLEFSADSLIGHPTLITRLTAALMADDYATTWDALD